MRLAVRGLRFPFRDSNTDAESHLPASTDSKRGQADTFQTPRLSLSLSFFNPLDPQHVTDNTDTKERVGASVHCNENRFCCLTR